MCILSKKMKGKSKKGVSWNQGGRNRKLLGKAVAASLEIMEQMKRPIDFPPQEELTRIRKKLSDPNYEGGNILISETAPVEEKMKYSVSQSILTYQQESKKTFATLVKEIEIQNLTVKNLLDICRGKLTDFSLGELLVYANNLRITNIPCYHCGFNLYPPLFG